MSTCALFLDLSPLPPPDAGALRFGLHVFGALEKPTDAQERVDALRLELEGIAGNMPEEPVDQPGFKPWGDVEAAYVRQLGEFLPWCWSSSEIKLLVGQQYLAVNPRVVRPAAPTMHQDSLEVARRGYLLALYNGSAGFSDPLMFQQQSRAPSGSQFSFLMFSAQATRWPAPVPHEALQTVTVLEIPRASLEAAVAADPQAVVVAVVAFDVAGRAYAVPPAPRIDPDRSAVWSQQSGVDELVFRSAGLRCSEVLQPPNNLDSFLHPADSLWLRSALQDVPAFDPDEIVPGNAIGDHDWWSRLHEGIASAVEVPRLIIDALRRAPESAELQADFAKSLLALCGALRDTMEPGIARDPTHPNVTMYPFARSPVMLDLLAAWRAGDQSLTTPLDLLAIASDARVHGWPDFTAPPAGLSADDIGRIALVYCALHRETFAPPSLWEWYSDFRALSSTLSERLPEFKAGTATVTELQSRLERLSTEERLALLEELRVEAMRPAVRARALLGGWERAVAPSIGDNPTVSAAKTYGASFLQQLRRGISVKDKTVSIEEFFAQHDPGRLFVATASLGAVRLATRSQPSEDKKARFATKIASAAITHAQERFSAQSTLQPILGIDPATHFVELKQAADDVAEESHRWIFHRDGVNASGQPSPLVLQLDTLNDDSDLQAGETDLNQWLNGYAAFYRRAAPAAAASPWGCGQVGNIEARMWRQVPMLLDAGGAPLLAVTPLPATMSYGVRQVLLAHDNRSLLPARSLDMIDSRESTQLANGWSGAESFVVVADGSVALPDAARLPFLAFGVDYEAVVFAEARSGLPPSDLAGGFAGDAPYRIDWSSNIQNLLNSSAQRRLLPYRRRTTVSAPRVKPCPGTRDVASRLPASWSPMSVSRELNLAHTAWPYSNDVDKEAQSVCVLLSAAGLPFAEPLPETWTRLRFELMPPSCTYALYDRWIAYEHAVAPSAQKAAWAEWRERIHASELLISGWQGQPADEATRVEIVKVTTDPRAQLDDPAVAAFVFTWKPLRGDSTTVDELILPLSRPTGPLVPTAPNPNDDSTILFDRGRAGPPDWTFSVQAYDGPSPRPNRFVTDFVSRVVTVWLWPGEIGDLSVASAVTSAELAARCNLEPSFTTSGYGVFASWQARFEICTAHWVGETELFAHCSASVSENRNVSLLWNRHEVPTANALTPALLAVDNVGELRPYRQVWYATGRPLPAFPSDCKWLDDMQPLSALEDGSADATASGVVWDAVGFAERFSSSAIWTQAKRLGLGGTWEVLHEEEAGSDPAPRYIRYGVQARHRYAELYAALVTDRKNQEHFAPLTACQVGAAGPAHPRDEWLRAYRPGAGVAQVPRPAVRMVVPLTRSLAPTPNATGADLLVVLNEELDTTSALATRLEAAIEPVTRDLINQQGDEEHLSMLEHAPDPILSGAAQQGTLVGLSCIGPLGHTFDTDTREPHFAGVSYLVQTGSLLSAWEFAKLSFRRLLAPELMQDYYLPPTAGQGRLRIVTAPTRGPLELGGTQLQEHGQGHLTLQGLEQGVADTSLGIEFFGESLALSLHRDVADDGSKTHTWTLRADGGLPPDAFLDTDWRAVQKFRTVLSERLHRADFRVVVARVREAKPEIGVPARWEVAGYAAISTRPASMPAEEGPQLPWDRRWTRVLTWQLDEPEDLAATRVRLTTNVIAAHGMAQANCRVSGYTSADWVQTLPDSAAVAIGDTPWVNRAGATPLELRIRDTGTFELGIFEDGNDAALNWHRAPVPLGQDGQGLHHLLLVTRKVQTADGSPSEAYIGVFNQSAQLGNRFLPVELYRTDARVPAASDLCGYVLLVQRSARTHAGPAVGFWDAVFPTQGSDPRMTRDARLRILAVGEPIHGVGASA
jgi:hypothetical protein